MEIEPLFSTLQGRPALVTLTREFAIALPGLAADVADAAATGLEQVRKLAHRLKGSAGGYGFPEIARTAAEIETAARAGDGTVVTEATRRLCELCERARAGATIPEATAR